MNLPLDGEIIDIQAYKHNGELYRQGNGVKVIEVSQDTIVLFMYKTKVVEQNHQRWIVREPVIGFFPTNEGFNTTALIRKTGIFFYTNLASVPVFEDGKLKFIDYDLDVKNYPDNPIKIVDKQEFIKNIKRFRYSTRLVDKINRTTNQVVKYIKLNDGYFNEKIVAEYVNELIEKKHLSTKTKLRKS